MLRQLTLPLLLAFISCVCCQTDLRSILTRASQHLTGILGRQYQSEAISAGICFNDQDVLNVTGETIDCKDQSEGIFEETDTPQ